jgi:hypothetical protein
MMPGRMAGIGEERLTNREPSIGAKVRAQLDKKVTHIKITTQGKDENKIAPLKEMKRLVSKGSEAE